jgi:DinB superfamily
VRFEVVGFSAARLRAEALEPELNAAILEIGENSTDDSIGSRKRKMKMSTENSLIDAALRGWKANIERVDKLFGALSPEQLEQQVTPGENRLIYLWGHLAAVNDGLLPLLDIGERLHPEFNEMFITKPDRSVELTVTAQSLKFAWDKINQKLWEGFSKFSPADWAG